MKEMDFSSGDFHIMNLHQGFGYSTTRVNLYEIEKKEKESALIMESK
jgi:hypothetical protein